MQWTQWQRARVSDLKDEKLASKDYVLARQISFRIVGVQEMQRAMYAVHMKPFSTSVLRCGVVCCGMVTRCVAWRWRWRRRDLVWRGAIGTGQPRGEGPRDSYPRRDRPWKGVTPWVRSPVRQVGRKKKGSQDRRPSEGRAPLDVG